MAVIVPGDHDSDGKTDHAVYRPGATQGAASYFYIRKSTDGSMLAQSWGIQADQPSSGDFDGDGKSDFVVRRLTGSAGETTTYVLEADGGSQAIPFGWRSDVIVPGDYDSDGKTDLARVPEEPRRLNYGSLSQLRRVSGFMLVRAPTMTGRSTGPPELRRASNQTNEGLDVDGLLRAAWNCPSCRR